MSVMSNYSIMLFKSSISLLIFCPVVLSTIKTRVLKSTAITVELYTSLFNSHNVFFTYLGVLIFAAYIF